MGCFRSLSGKNREAAAGSAPTEMITIFGWVAAICFAIFAVVFACTSAIVAIAAAIAYSPLGTVLRPWLSGDPVQHHLRSPFTSSAEAQSGLGQR
jgi:hypothetical protein